MGADGSSTARVQRGPSEAARCASTEDHQAPSPSSWGFREQGDQPGYLSPAGGIFQHPVNQPFGLLGIADSVSRFSFRDLCST